MATDVGAGAAVEARITPTFVVEAVRNIHLGAAVIMGSATVAGVTARCDRTEAQDIMLGVGIIPIRSVGGIGGIVGV